jgi:5-methylthioadenosine/S-adenosylhomocysteine deaminase
MMPSLVNCHVHGQGTLAKEDRWPIELLLNAFLGPTGNRSIVDKYLNALATVEMIGKGRTSCYDLFFEFPRPPTSTLYPGLSGPD